MELYNVCCEVCSTVISFVKLNISFNFSNKTINIIINIYFTIGKNLDYAAKYFLAHLRLSRLLIRLRGVGYEEFCRSRRVDSTLRDLQKSSYPTKAELNNCFIIHSKCFPVLEGVLPFRSLFFGSPK